MYVIVNTQTGKYVSPPGQMKSYTEKLEEARIFNAKEQALKECCIKNEYVSKIEDLLNKPN